ncbi:MAG: response regulator [Caulobacteraceae bacterium]
MSAPTSALRILVVEDEMMVAMLVEDMLTDLGHEVAGVAHSLSSALSMIEAKAGEFDLAVLDINLSGEPSFPAARRLMERGTPFLFATGYGAMGLEEPFGLGVHLEEAFRQEDLAQAVERAIAA